MNDALGNRDEARCINTKEDLGFEIETDSIVYPRSNRSELEIDI